MTSKKGSRIHFAHCRLQVVGHDRSVNCDIVIDLKYVCPPAPWHPNNTVEVKKFKKIGGNKLNRIGLKVSRCHLIPANKWKLSFVWTVRSVGVARNILRIVGNIFENSSCQHK